MIRTKAGRKTWICSGVVGGRPCTTMKPSTPTPASSGSTRQARGAFGVTRRVTPSGDIRTRCSASRDTMAAASGTPSATSSTSGRLSDRSPGKKGAPVNGIDASGTRSRKNRPKPAAIPATAATVDSTAAMSETCRGVAPASRIAANRSSRRAADSLVAVPMKMSSGNKIATATTDMTRSMLFAFMPSPGRHWSP